VVDRSTFQAELDALPVREKARCDAGGHGCMGSKQYDRKDAWGPVAELVGIEGGVVSGVFNLESSGVEAPDRRPRHEEHYHEA